MTITAAASNRTYTINNDLAFMYEHRTNWIVGIVDSRHAGHGVYEMTVAPIVASEGPAIVVDSSESFVCYMDDLVEIE